jgi:hypothetical protein
VIAALHCSTLPCLTSSPILAAVRAAWVREMYTWDVACAMHPEITIKLLKPPNSTLMLQSPFDSALNKAAFCHYTWGALFYDKPPSQGGTNIYSWNKREYMTWTHVVKVGPLL